VRLYKFWSLLFASRPAAAELDLPDITADPYLLSQLVADLLGTIVVTENGETLSLSQPLGNDRHYLKFQRVMPDGCMSRLTNRFDNRSLIVDTLTPKITPGDFERETSFPHMLLTLKLADNVIKLYINENYMTLGECQQTESYKADHVWAEQFYTIT